MERNIFRMGFLYLFLTLCEISMAQVVIDRVAYGKFSMLLPTSGTGVGGCASIAPGEREYDGVITILPYVTEINSPTKFIFDFNDCKNLKGVYIPNSIEYIYPYAMKGCDGLNLTLPNSIIFIGPYAFYGCGNINIPDSVVWLQSYAFAGCGITVADIPKTITSLETGLFSECRSLEKVNIPGTVTNIGQEVFSGCSGLTSITIPNSVKNIGNEAFSGCSGLTSITIPNSVKSIGNETFSGCPNIKEITCYEAPIEISNSVFDNSIIPTAKLKVPNMFLSEYTSADVWKDFRKIEGFRYLYVRPKNVSREYGEDNPSFECIYDTDVPFKNDPIIECNVNRKTSAGSYLIKITNSDLYDEEYETGDGILTITKAPLIASVGNYTIMKGESIPQFSISYSGFKNGETEETASMTKPTAYTYASETFPAGEYEIFVSGGSSRCYDFTYKCGKLTIVDPSGINDIHATDFDSFNVYAPSGLLVRRNAKSLDGLPRGVYIINKKKILVK